MTKPAHLRLWRLLREVLKPLGWALAFGSMTLLARADVLIGTNGERFVGTIVSDSTNSVVFDSDFGGRLIFPRARVRELRRTPPPGEAAAAAARTVPTTNAPVAVTSTNLNWQPPGVGHDGSDWVQLKSGEWLRGELRYIQDDKVEFDSDELDELTLKLDDVRTVYAAHRVLTQFEGQAPIYGRVVVSNDVVIVQGPEPEPVREPRESLIGVTPGGGANWVRYWSGKANVGLSLQSGNNKQTTMTASAELARRTPNTRLLFDYLGNYSKVNSVESANNNRFNALWDIRFSRHWFVRPLQAEYYNDPIANISYRLTGGVGMGYAIFDTSKLDWRISAGPAYQYTKFETVQAGESDTATTPAAVLQSNFEVDITRRITFTQTFASTFTKREAGHYTHHAVTTLEFEIKRHLDLDVSFVWDYLENPQPDSGGVVAGQNDYYTTISLGVRF